MMCRTPATAPRVAEAAARCRHQRLVWGEGGRAGGRGLPGEDQSGGPGTRGVAGAVQHPLGPSTIKGKGRAQRGLPAWAGRGIARGSMTARAGCTAFTAPSVPLSAMWQPLPLGEVAVWTGNGQDR